MSLREFVEQSELEEGDKNLWRDVFEFAADDLLAEFEQFVDGDLGNLLFLMEDIREKIGSIKDGDLSRYKSIIDKENEYLSSQNEL